MGPGSESQRDHKLKTLYFLYGVFYFKGFHVGRGACPAIAGSPSGITAKIKETVQTLRLSGFFVDLVSI